MIKSQLIDTKRGQFHYRELGDPQKPVLVLVHGYPQSGHCWLEVAKILESGYHLIIPDLRGMGDSNREQDKKWYSKDELAKDLIELLDELNIQSFFLAGHDWGGAVVQEMAFLIPERIQRLIILNIPVIHNTIGQKQAYEVLGKRLFSPFWYQFFQVYRGLAETLLEGKEEFWVRFCVRGIHTAISETAIQEYIRCYQIPGSITTFANLYRTMKADFKRWASPAYAGKKLNKKTLIIHGKLDTVIVPEYYEGIEHCFEQVRIEWVEAGHFVMDEKPGEVASYIEDFLRDWRYN